MRWLNGKIKRTKSVIYLCKEIATLRFNSGEILENRNSTNYVYTFKLFGLIYISNKNRKKKYNFDNKFWIVNRDSGFIKKIKMIYKKEVHRVK